MTKIESHWKDKLYAVWMFVKLRYDNSGSTTLTIDPEGAFVLRE